MAAIDKLPFASFEYNGASDAFRVRRINGESCAGELPPESAEKLTLVVALRHVEELFTREPAPCPPAEGDVVANLSFNIVEHTPPDTAGELALTSSCITRHGALQDIVESTEQVAASLAEACR